MMDIQKIKEIALTNGFSLKEQASGNMDLNSYVYDFANAIEQAAKTQVPEGFALVPKEPIRKGGYYIQDLRLPIGNCMKFWYQSGYGTKQKKFFWCETYEKAKEYQGNCDWFEIWYAPYIDSLVEYTVDMQLADRTQEKVMIQIQDQLNDPI